MSLYKPYFVIEPVVTESGEESYRVRHNCNGNIGFCSTEDHIDAHTGYLIKLAVAEGKRERSREINKFLDDK